MMGVALCLPLQGLYTPPPFPVYSNWSLTRVHWDCSLANCLQSCQSSPSPVQLDSIWTPLKQWIPATLIQWSPVESSGVNPRSIQVESEWSPHNPWNSMEFHLESEWSMSLLLLVV